MLLIALAAALQLSAGAHGVGASDGTTLRFTETGTGPAIVLLAGGPGFSASYLQPLADRLAPGYRSILLDQRGTGQSPVAVYDRSSINREVYVDDLERLREALGAEDLVLVGHSWGGMLAMAYAAEHPDRVRALVLVGSGGPTLDFWEPFDRNLTARLTADDRRNYEHWSDPGVRRQDPKRASIEMLKANMPGYFFDRGKSDAFSRSLSPADFEQRVFDLMTADLDAKGYDLRQALAALRVPVVLVQGKQDPIATADVLHEALPSSRLELIDGAGHFPWLEQPDAFFRVLRDFLAPVTQGR